MSEATTVLGRLITGPAPRDAIHIAVAPVVAGMDLQPGDRVGLNDRGEAYYAYEKTVGIVDPFLTETVQAGQRFYLCLYPGTITGLHHVWTHPVFDHPEAVSSPPTTPAVVKVAAPAEPSWRTPRITALCRKMLADDDFESLPILADQIEEAGYDDREVLDGFRSFGPTRRAWRHRHEARRLVLLFLDGEEVESVRWIDDFAASIDKTFNQLMDSADSWVEHEEHTYDNSEAYKDVDYDKWAEFWEHYEVLTGRKPKDPDDTFYSCSC